jgi:uncharacterized protein
MAVITRFVVVRKGVELDQVFTDKREAEAYDKMLDAAENLADFIKNSDLDLNLDGQTIDAIAVFLAKNGPEVSRVLKGVKPLVPARDTEVDPEKIKLPAKEKNKDKESRPKRQGK